MGIVQWGIVFRWGSLWVGGHYSAENKRWCINLVPCFTFWICARDGIAPKQGHDIIRGYFK